MPALAAYLRAAHAEPAAAVTAVATALAAGAGAGPGGSLRVLLAFAAGQLSIGWSNDWLDAARDRQTGRRDKPAATGQLHPERLRLAAAVAAACCVPLSLALGWRAGIAHLVAVAGAWAYNLGLKSTAASFAPYAVSFGLLPSVVTLSLPGSPWAPAWATAAGALLGVGAHLANTLPDLAADRATGVRGLPHRLGAGPAGVAAGLLLLGATCLLAASPAGHGPTAGVAVGVAAAVTVAGAVRGRRPGSRAPFRAAICVALVDVALLLAGGGSLVAG